jgi:hypothetical protein
MKIAHIERVKLVEGLDRDASRTYRLWESAGHVLKEFQLDPKQIEQLFAQVEKDATAAGGNRTAIGKGADAVGKGIDTATAAGKAVKKAYDDLVDQVQNSGPVKNFDSLYDQGAEKLKQATGGDQGAMKYVQKYRDFAKKHPIAQGIVYSMIIAAAGLSGAGLGGAAAIGLFKMADKLLQGEKFSTAVGKGAVAGAMAYGASQVLGGGDLPNDPNAPGYQVGADGPAQAPGQFDVPPPVDDAAQQAIDAAKDTAADAAEAGAKSAATDAAKQAVTRGGTDSATDAATRAAGRFAGDYNADAAEAIRDAGVEHLKQGVATQVVQGASEKLLGDDQIAGPAIKAIADRLYSGLPLTDIQRNALEKAYDGALNVVGMVSNPNNPLQAAFGQVSIATSEGAALQGDAAAQAAWSHWQNMNILVQKSLEASARLSAVPGYESKQHKGQMIKEYIDAQSTVRHWALKESLGRPRGGVRLTEAGVNRVFELVETHALNEGIMDTLKGAAGKVGGALKGAAGKAGAAIAQTGKNLTNKITADKLKKAWEFEGGNTDSEAIKIFLKQQGVDQAVIDGAMQSVGVKPAADAGVPGGLAPASKGPAAAGASQFVKDLVDGYMALTAAEKAEIMKELDIAIDVSGNSNLVKGMNESKRRKKKAVK